MPASKAQRAAAAQKRAQATALRIAGMDWQTIADRVGYRSAGAACTAVTQALKTNLAEEKNAVEDLRRLTVARYDRLQQAFWPAAMKGDKKAADVILKCLDGRAKIEGTAAPQQVETSVTAAVSLPDLLAKANSRALAEDAEAELLPETEPLAPEPTSD